VKPVFADASYYVALLSPRDQHHDAAIAASSMLRRPIVLTDFVLIEIANALSSLDSRSRATALWAYLASEPSVTIIPGTPELIAKGRQLYDNRKDKEWSLTDCISFVAMQE
jgi:predicted nucleic acid-binding protein